MTVFNPSALTATPDAVAQALVDNGAPAALVSIYDGLRSAHAVAGVDDLDADAPAQLGQTFEAGSQTKMVAAVVVLKLAEAGLLDLDNTLADYLPAELLDGIANADTATIRDVLAMRSGIADFTSVVDEDGFPTFDLITAMNPDTVIGTDVALDLVRGAPASFAPGTAYQYSNTGYALLGELIEAVTEASLAEVMNALVFEPLGMDSTWLDDQSVDANRLSSYFKTEDDVFDVTDTLQDLSAEGGLISTTADMTTFVEALLVDQSLLSPDSLAQMMTFVPTGTDGMGFGLGLFGFDLGSDGTLLGFTGGTLGTSTATFLHVETGRIISTAVTMTNLEVSGASALGDVMALLETDLAWDPAADGDALEVLGVSAAQLDIAETDDGFQIAAEGAALNIDADLAGLDRTDMVFDDGSVLLTGVQGRDQIVLSPQDTAFAADNQVLGLGGHDLLETGSGNDKLVGGQGHDRLRGQNGNDTLEGGAGHDKLAAGAGHDMLSGGVGNDSLKGGTGRDHMLGGGGNDVLFGGMGHDTLKGGAGQDWLTGGSGHDAMAGGADADVFVFGDVTENGRQEFDTISDFDVTEDMVFIGDAQIADMSNSESGLILTFAGDGDAVLLAGVTDADALMFV